MSNPTLLSPNADNIQVGKGIVSFKKNGDSTFVDLGNVSALTITPTVTTLEHFTSRLGTKKKDLMIVLEQKCEAKITMEEMTAYNLSLLLYGDVDTAAAGGPTVEIFGESQIFGELKFVGTNDVGPRMTVDLFNVSFTPQGDLNMISDEFNKMEVQADVLAATGVVPVPATGVYTATTNFTDADTVTIAGKVYTIQASLTNVDGHVKLGASLTASLLNLKNSINNSGGVAGTDYAVANSINPSVTATASTATTLSIAAKVGGVAGNSIATVDSSTSGSFAGATLAGGVDGNVNAGRFGTVQFTNIAP